MRLPQDRILHIDTKLEDGKMNIVAEWQGELVRCKDCKYGETSEVNKYYIECTLNEVPTFVDGFCSYGKRKTPTIPTFAESAEAYKAWTGEEMGKTSDEINEMNNEIIKDILKMMPTAYLLEALGVSTFEELTEQADRPHGEWIDQHEDGHNYWVGTCNQCGKYSKEVGNYCPNCGAKMGGAE